jgi:hypothetical protein
MITPAFVFTIFMLTLGPTKTVPAFFAMTQDHLIPRLILTIRRSYIPNIAMTFVLRIVIATSGAILLVAPPLSAETTTPIHIWLRAFIPNSLQSPSDYIKKTTNGLAVISAPGVNIAGVNIGPLSGTCFTTDNRGFDSSPNASARVSVNFNLVIHGHREISVEKVGSQNIVAVGETHNVDCTTGRDLRPPQQEDATSVNISDVKQNGFLRIFNVKAMSGNPFYRVFGVGVAPKIDIEVVFEYDPLTLSLTLHGVIGNFPSFEAYYSVANGPTTMIENLPPTPGSTALSLIDLGTGLNMRNFEDRIQLQKYLMP